MISIDSNILLYFEGLGDEYRQSLAIDVLSTLNLKYVRIAQQALGELYWVLLRKAKRSRSEAAACVENWQDSTLSLPTTTSAFRSALHLATNHKLQIWDAIIVATSKEHGCKALLSEDMQDGFLWQGIEVINPFAPDAAARLAQHL